MARIHRRAIQTGLNDLDNYDGRLTHLELDILECEVKLACGRTIVIKAGSDEIPTELFKIPKDKHGTHYISKI